MTNGAKILITIAAIITLVIVVRTKVINKPQEENVVSNNVVQKEMVDYIDDYEK